MRRVVVVGAIVLIVVACSGGGRSGPARDAELPDRAGVDAVEVDAPEVDVPEPGAVDVPRDPGPSDGEPAAEPRPEATDVEELDARPESLEVEADVDAIEAMLPDPGPDVEATDLVEAVVPDAPDTPSPDVPLLDAPALDAELAADAPDQASPDLATPDPQGPDAEATDPVSQLVQTGLCAAKLSIPWSRSIRGVGGTATFNELMLQPLDGTGGAWIELANPMAVDLDVSGWRLDGAVGFAFDEGTRVPAGGFLVIAADPAALAAATGVSALGPFEDSLPPDGGELLLRSNTDRLMDALVYGDAAPWPVTPRGAGASLAKRAPDASSEWAEAWFGSPRVGGTPGQPNAASGGASAAAPGARLHEVAGGGSPFWVELVNPGVDALDLDGVAVASSAGGRAALAPRALAPGELALFDEADLGFAVQPGQRVFLFAADGVTVLDGVDVQDVPRGRATPGDGPWLVADTSSPGAPNLVVTRDAIVINEIMYHDSPVDLPSGPQASAEEWIELFNRSAETVDVSGWQLVDDVRFTLPAGLDIPPGGYLVVARNASALKSTHGGVPIVGDFEGKLDNAGANVVLLDACGTPVDEVHYRGGGRWPAPADGGGSSLELRSPLADNAVPEAWAASDEAANVQWKTYSYQGVAAPSPVGPDGQWHELVLGLLDRGVVLLDDVSVVEDPAGAALELLQDGSFESGSALGWRLLGNHRRSEVVPDPANPSNHVLRLVATGATEHMHNHAETTLAGGHTVTNGLTYRISFRARWESGSNQLNTRLYFNRLARTTLLPRPALTGTPGKPNGALVPNVGPTYRDFAHAPAVPAPDQPVAVTVVASDPDGVDALTLQVSVDGGPFVGTPMLDPGDGRWVAVVAGHPAGTVVQVYVEGTDALGAASTFPAAGPGSRALWKVDDGLAATNGLHNLRIVLTPADAAWLHAEPNVMSNDLLGATVIYDEREVFYDVGVRLKGSERGRSIPWRTGFVLRFDPEQPFRGVYDSVMVDRSEGVNFGQREILINQVMSHAGSLSAEYDDLVQVMPPRLEHTGAAELQLARFGDLLLDAQFEDGSDGPTYEYELIYYPYTTADGTPEGPKLPQPDWVVGTPIHDLGDDEESYRLSFLLGNSLWKDDFAPLLAFAKVFGLSGPELEAQIGDVIDLDQWLRAFAFATLSGAIDNYASGAQHNAVLYVRPSDGRVLYFPHDLDFYLGASTVPVVASPDLARLIATPTAHRLYYAHLADILDSSYNAAYLGPWCEHFGALLAPQDFASHLQFVTSRAEWVRTTAPDAITVLYPQVPFQITTNDGADVVVAEPQFALEGTAWVDVREIWRFGDAAPLDLAWIGPGTWRVDVPLACGGNLVLLQAVGLHGQAVGTDSLTVTSTAEGCP